MKYSFEKLLEYVRTERNFDVNLYVTLKTHAVHKFLSDNDINTIVLPISGGIDSAVVLALLDCIKKYSRNLHNVVPIFMPIHGDGITGQNEAEERAKQLVAYFGYEFYKLDLTGVYHEMIKAVKPFTHGSKTIPSNSSGVLSSWTKGQMACILRTPMNYFVAAILQQAHNRSLICGTTNRDEGSYIGFFGKAGFFYDSSTENYNIDDSLDIMCTPLNFLKKSLNVAKPCVLLTTGSFSPIHAGHIEMLINSKAELEKDGWDVIGGYFAPDHDEYISEKLKEEAIPIHYRMKYINDAIRDINWLAVDAWAGVFQKCAVNFTDIIIRLEKYIEKHLGKHIPVIYVCGQDNVRFSHTFLDKGYCCVVNRPGYSPIPLSDRKIGTDRIYEVENNNSLSSTKIRQINKWSQKKKDVIVRFTGDAKELEQNLSMLLEKRFENIEISVSKEQDRALRTIRYQMITLDPFTTNGLPFQISREYDFFGMKRLGFTERPGSRPLSEQIEVIIKNNWHEGYFLHDDDICSGDTMRYARKMLEAFGIDIIATMSYSMSNSSKEILDMRDLIYGSNEGGLVIKDINGKSKRVPYIYPYVCPFARASINDPMQFSIDVWRINADYYRSKGDWKIYQECFNNIELLTKFVYAK